MATPRSTAVLEFNLPSSAIAESLPLTSEREFGVCLHIDGQERAAGLFHSPINDAQWRDFSRWLAKCNNERDPNNYQQAQAIRNCGRDLYRALAALSTDLANFLAQTGTPRRLVIQTTRPELHQLPWGALYDAQLSLLAAGDLSIVQTWGNVYDSDGTLLEPGGFHLDSPLSFSSTVNLVTKFGNDVQKSTLGALAMLPPEITRFPAGPFDILHLEQHGNEVLNQVGDTVAMKLADTYPNTGMALLWSCFSSSPNSWGQSPALALHRKNAALVLSFQAELNVADAKSIAQDFYAEVFGPAATRDPETALVGIRAARFDKDFAFANWASMTVFLSRPLDLSALPLNGPRVPPTQWTKDDTAPEDLSPWQPVVDAINSLQPSSLTNLDAAALGPIPKLPRYVFKDWRGNVIRLDGDASPLSDETLNKLNIPLKEAKGSSAADRLIWFFDRISHFGAPLIVWTNSQPRHLEFLEAIAPSSTLTFLLLYGPPPAGTVASLVDANDFKQAISLFEAAPPTDPEALAEARYFAYFAYCRSGRRSEAEALLLSLDRGFEFQLLAGNFVSRYERAPGDTSPISSELQQRHCEEDFYRRAIDAAAGDTLLRDRGRARHELAFCMQSQGRTATAELFYRMALQDLDRSLVRDPRWNYALAACLRDWADLLAHDASRAAEAGSLLHRALAIHTYQSRPQQIAYALATRAQIALTSCRLKAAIDDALDAANSFEICSNWWGWMQAFSILLQALADSRETARMLALIKLARTKVPGNQLEGYEPTLRYGEANAHWIAGLLDEARFNLDSMERMKGSGPPQSDTAKDVARLEQFLSTSSNQSTP
jgi:rhodanese-related sulfurtransferase